MELNETALSDLTDEIKKLHADFIAEIHKRELSASENFDKSILTFSSAGLALSIGFLKDFMPIQVASQSWTLYLSWTLFTIATCSTMVSFLVSGLALAEQKKLAFRFYIERNEAAFNEANNWNWVTQGLNYLSGGAFLLALILTVIFISINLEKGSAMKQLDNNFKATMHAATPELLQKGLTVPTMQQIPASSKVPVPSSQPANTTPAPQASNPSGK